MGEWQAYGTAAILTVHVKCMLCHMDAASAHNWESPKPGIVMLLRECRRVQLHGIFGSALGSQRKPSTRG